MTFEEVVKMLSQRSPEFGEHFASNPKGLVLLRLFFIAGLLSGAHNPARAVAQGRRLNEMLDDLWAQVENGEKSLEDAGTEFGTQRTTHEDDTRRN